MPELKVPRGLRDRLPEDMKRINYVISILRELFEVYGYEEVSTPTIEFAEVLSMKVGNDIRLRMYEFEDLGGRRIALRPEMTTPIARLVATKMKTWPKPIRLSYIANCFRYDEPQLGRYREFLQAGFELIGSPYPEADVEILMIANDLMNRLGFKEYTFKIGHVGILRGILEKSNVSEDEQNLIMSLIDKGRKDEAIKKLAEMGISSNCLEVVKTLLELKGRNYEEIMSTGKELLSNYRYPTDSLENLQEILGIFTSVANPSIEVELGFARGLEYYTGMIFEVYVPDLKIALIGGGRYDGLIELFGGGKVPAVGCAPGIDRIVLAMKRFNLFPDEEPKLKTLVVALTPELSSKAFEIATKLRREGIITELAVKREGFAKALSYASSKSFTFAILLASKELREGKVTLRHMKKRIQEVVPLNELVEKIKSTL